MRTKNSPSAMAARGGQTNPVRGAVPSRGLRSTILLAAAIALALPSCTSRVREAFFATLPAWPEAGPAMSQFASSSRMDQ